MPEDSRLQPQTLVQGGLFLLLLILLWALGPAAARQSGSACLYRYQPEALPRSGTAAAAPRGSRFCPATVGKVLPGNAGTVAAAEGEPLKERRVAAELPRPALC